jgi:C-terminal processing protease CtpA/Prc
MDAQSAAEILVSAPNTPVSLTIEKHIILPAKNTPMFRNIFYIAQFINFGIKLSLRPSGLLVTYVKPQGEAQKSGLRLMDEITYINQESVRYMPVSLVRKKIFQSKLDEVVLTVRRQIILTRRE